MLKWKLIILSRSISRCNIINTPSKPKGSFRYKVLDQNKEEDNPTTNDPLQPSEKEIATSVDQEGAWVKESGETPLWIKKHHLTDEEPL